jgi:hypothetical protein
MSNWSAIEMFHITRRLSGNEGVFARMKMLNTAIAAGVASPPSSEAIEAWNEMVDPGE